MTKFVISKNLETKKRNNHWQFCVGSGHAGLALRKDYCEQLKVVHDELGIQRVRFHGIFCDDLNTIHTLSDVMPLAGGDRFTEQSFHMAGKVYDNVLASGMKPFVELGFMPKHLAKNPEQRGMFFYKPICGLPKSDEAWTSYIRDFVNYLIRRYGREEIETWFFEVWNEPDLAFAFFYGTQEDYFHLYEITARTIKEIDPNIKVGGPATSGSKWVKSFVAFCKEHDVPVDFITTHQYAGDPLGGVSDEGGPDPEDVGMEMTEEFSAMMSIDPKQMDYQVIGAIYQQLGVNTEYLPDCSVLDAIRIFNPDNTESEKRDRDLFPKNAAIVKQQAAGMPVYYTEWNTCAAFGAPGNDTRKVAAYNLRTILALDEIIDGSSIWCFSDIFEELHPFPQEFHGGFGLQTINGIPKPVFHGLKMLKEAGEDEVVIPGGLDGEISIAAFRKGADTQVLLIRQELQHFTYEHEPKQKVQVCIETDSKPTALTLKRIDENHCNPLKLWQEMGCTLDLTPAEIAAIKDGSAMAEEAMDFTYEDGKLMFEAELGINDVYFVTAKA